MLKVKFGGWGMDKLVSIEERTFQFRVRVTKLCNYLYEQKGTSLLLANSLARSRTSIPFAQIRKAIFDY
jgi:hypothetical protein